MSTLDNRSGSAVLLIDPQVGVVEGTFERDAVIAAVGRLLERAREEGVPVVWVQHNDEHVVRGTEGWQFVPELAPGPGEPLVEKSFADAFEATTLEDELATLGVDRLVVAGAETDACVRSTVHGGLTRGYDVTLVSDAHRPAVMASLRNFALSRHRLAGATNIAAACRDTGRHPARAAVLLT